MIRYLVALCVLSSPVMAEGFDGQYQLEACTPGVSDTQMSISGSEIGFWESLCTLTTPEPVRGMEGAVLYDMECSGEGMTWTRRVLLMPGQDDGLIFVRDGFAFTYARCD